MVDYDITDHCPVMALVNNKLNHKNVQPKFAKSFAKFNSDSYNNDLQKRINRFVPKILTISENNVDDILVSSTC